MNLKPIEISKQTETHAKPSYPFTLIVKQYKLSLCKKKCDDVERHEEKWKIENNAIGVDDFFEQLSRG